MRRRAIPTTGFREVSDRAGRWGASSTVARVIAGCAVVFAIAVTSVRLGRCGTARFPVGPPGGPPLPIPVRVGRAEGVIIPGRFADAATALANQTNTERTWTPNAAEISVFEQGLDRFLRSAYPTHFAVDAATHHVRRYAGRCAASDAFLDDRDRAAAGGRPVAGSCALWVLFDCEPARDWRLHGSDRSERGDVCRFTVLYFPDRGIYATDLDLPPAIPEIRPDGAVPNWFTVPGGQQGGDDGW